MSNVDLPSEREKPVLFTGFAEQVLKPIVGFAAMDLLQKLSRDLWSVTFARGREVVFAIAFLVGLGLSGAAIYLALAAGVPISVPIAGFLLLFIGYLFAAALSPIIKLKGWLSTPEMDAILLADAAREAAESALATAQTGAAAAVERRQILSGYLNTIENILYDEGTSNEDTKTARHPTGTR